MVSTTNHRPTSFSLLFSRPSHPGKVLEHTLVSSAINCYLISISLCGRRAISQFQVSITIKLCLTIFFAGPPRYPLHFLFVLSQRVKNFGRTAIVFERHITPYSSSPAMITHVRIRGEVYLSFFVFVFLPLSLAFCFFFFFFLLRFVTSFESAFYTTILNITNK